MCVSRIVVLPLALRYWSCLNKDKSKVMLRQEHLPISKESAIVSHLYSMPPKEARSLLYLPMQCSSVGIKKASPNCNVSHLFNGCDHTSTTILHASGNQCLIPVSIRFSSKG